VTHEQEVCLPLTRQSLRALRPPVLPDVGGAASGVLYFSSHADPTVIAMTAAIPPGLAISFLALSRLVKRVKETVEAAPPVIHQHYNGTVVREQRSINTQTRGVWSSNRNELPR